jgi:hypothetical protein
MPVKSGVGDSSWVTIRTGVNATGVVQNVNRYPAENIRICPSTFNVDWMNCATRNPQDMTRIAKIRPSSNNAYGIRTVGTGTGTPVSYYKFQWLEFIPNAYGGNSLIGLLNDTAPINTGSAQTMTPHHFTFDQIVVRGDPFTGQYRGFQVDANTVTLTNSFIYDIKARGEGQSFWANSSLGPITLINNYLSGGTEVFFTGGGGTTIEPSFTIAASPAPTATTFGLSSVTDLYVTKNIAFYLHRIDVVSTSVASNTIITTATPHGFLEGYQVDTNAVTGCSGLGQDPRRVMAVLSSTTFSVNYNCGTAGSGGTVAVRAQAEVTNISGNVVTVTPALPYIPVAGESAYSSTVILGLTARYNVFTRPHSHRTANILPTPTGSLATPSTTGGTLSAGTYGYRVNARVSTAQALISNSGAAAQVTATTTGSTGSVTVTWNTVAGASSYAVYGRTPNGQTMYWIVNAPTTTFTDTGSAGTSGSVVTSGDKWQVKNTFELKHARNVLIENNLIENSWQAGQSGPCVVFTGSQQGATSHSSVIRDLTFRNNEVRNCAQMMQISGTDTLAHESARSGGFNIYNNLFHDIGDPYGWTNAFILSGGGGGSRQTPDRAPFNVTINHNTMHFVPSGPTTALHVDYCHGWPAGVTPSHESISPNTLITNNIWYNGQYGLVSVSSATANCQSGNTTGRLGNPPFGAGSLVSTNVIPGGNCSQYTANTVNTQCPTVASIESVTFTNTTTLQGFEVKSTSPYYNAATDGTSIGANPDAIEPGIIVAMSGDNSGQITPPDPLTITTSSPLPTAVRGQVYSVTLAASGGTPPYTWEHTNGTIPAGLSFNPSNATLSGTPTGTVTARVLTFSVSDTSLDTVSKALTLTIVGLTNRASRYNWSEGASYIRTTAPANPIDQVRLGDTWFDLTNGKLKTANSLGPPIVWTEAGGEANTSSNLGAGTGLAAAKSGVNLPFKSLVAGTGISLSNDTNTVTITATGGGGGGLSPQHFTFLATSGTESWADVPALGGEWPNNANRHRVRANLVGYTQCLVVGYFTNAGIAASDLLIQYFDSGSGLWTSTGATVNVGASGGEKTGSYQTLATNARIDQVSLRPFIDDGDGAVDMAASHIQMLCKP